MTPQFGCYTMAFSTAMYPDGILSYVVVYCCVCPDGILSYIVVYFTILTAMYPDGILPYVVVYFKISFSGVGL